MTFYFSSDRTSVCERRCRRNVRVFGRFAPHGQTTDSEPARLFVGGVALLLAASPIVIRSPPLLLPIVMSIVYRTKCIDSYCSLRTWPHRPVSPVRKTLLFFFMQFILLMSGWRSVPEVKNLYLIYARSKIVGRHF